MRKLTWMLAFVALFALQGFAQEHYTEGPVWRVTTIRVKPAQMDAYLTSLRQGTKPLLDEEKRQGIIMDYKVFLKETWNDPKGLGYRPGGPLQEPCCYGQPGGQR